MSELLAHSHDGAPVTALDEGAGPVVLVVHPGGSEVNSWDGVSRSLTPDFRVVRIRRRIYVPGADLTRPHSMAVEAADILAIAGLLEPPVLLVGHSSGGVAALEAVLRSPSSFAGMLLYEPPVPTTSLLAGPAGRRARAALDEGDPAEAMRIHMRDVVRIPGPEVDAMFANPGARAAFAAYAAAQVTDDEAIDALGIGTDRFAAVGTPTVLVRGDLTPAHLSDRVSDLAKALPDARIVTLTGQGHIAHLTAPEVLAAAIRDVAEHALRR